MKKVTIIIAALVVCIVGGAFAGAKWAGRNKKTLLEKVSEAVTEKSTIDVKTIEEVLQPAGDLITQRYYYTDVDTFENYKELLGAKLPLTTDKVVFTYKGVISAGIVLSKVDFEVDNEAKKITVTLPTVFIVSHEIDEDSFTAYEIKNSIFTETKIQEYSSLMGSLKHKKEGQLLKDEEFLDRAVKEAKNVITSFLKAASVTSDYTIEYK
ncbi:MAG: DUF4230 domain-containing protein [Lachnospiraceae bacterium]|nr:DUF4230 domain-containing protein [Lachnospiraceae bacterium]